MPGRKDGSRGQLGTLQQRAKELYDEDWEFRSVLKNQDPVQVDALVQRLLEEASRQIDCRHCMNCCRELSPQLDDKDIARLAKGLGMTAKAFAAKYLIEDDDEPGMYLMRDRPCPFLDKDGCTHYDLRPKECADFPHLEKKDFLCRTMSVISDQEVCPIAIEVYQGLKKILWKRASRYR